VLRPSAAILGDWTSFSQDDDSVAQVGEQKSSAEWRSFRLQVMGSFGGTYRVNYQLCGEYKGFDSDPEDNWQLTDMAVTLPIGDSTRVAVGKIKETFSYEMVGDAANLPHSERVLSPFFVSRNTGARITHVLGPAKRVNVSYGFANDTWDIGTSTQRGTDYFGRVSGLAWDDVANGHYLHLGASWRYAAADGKTRYKGRPGSNVSSNYVDTGDFPSDGANHYGLEGLFSWGGLSLLGEYARADVESPAKGDPRFSGWYLTGSWVLTGEARPYDRKVGYARRVIPTSRWGAPELIIRYSDVDLDDGPVQGGRFTRIDLGVNWWATTRWKFGLDLGRTELDRMGKSGTTDTVLTRIQWVY
jgi:phosphate-selective porin OprO/OprP